MKTLALLHTTIVTALPLKELAGKELPSIRVINLVDDSLLADVMAAGQVTPAVRTRLKAYVEQAAVAGASAIMTCCSSIGEAMEELRGSTAIPILRIDEAMAEEAVRAGARIGVIATVRTTLEPTTNLIRRKAAEAGVAAQVEAVLVEGAFDALMAGRAQEHDEKVLAALQALIERSDVVVLAQASMARLLSSLSQPPAAPILTSPQLGIRRAGTILTEKVN